MAIFRIVDGQKKLFAEINKVERVNGKTPGEDKNIILDAGDINYKDDRSIKDELDSIIIEQGDYIQKSAIATSLGSGRQQVLTGIVPIVSEDGESINVLAFSNDITKENAENHDVESFSLTAGNRIKFSNIGELNDGIPTDPYGAIISAETGDIESELGRVATLADRHEVEIFGGELENGETIPGINVNITHLNNELEETNKSLQTVNRTLFRRWGHYPEEDIDADGYYNGIEGWFPNTFMDVRSRFNELEARAKINPNDKVLVWKDEGLRAHLELKFNSSTGLLELLGKGPLNDETGERDRKPISEVNIALGSQIVYAKSHAVNGGILDLNSVEDDAIKVAIQAAQPSPLIQNGSYLILGFQSANGKVLYTFVDLSHFIDAYTNGNGLNLVDNEFSVRRDASSTYELSVGPDGIKFKAETMTAAEFEEIPEGDTSLDGVYYIIEE